MKPWNVCLLAMGTALSISACGTTAYREKAAAGIEAETNEADTKDAAAGAANKTVVETGDETVGSHKILIAYFTRLDNTDAELEEILQGGGPYGSLGDSLEGADLDAVSSASIQQIDGEVQGSTEAVARMIQENVGGDLFSIQTIQNYPVDYDTLIDQGGEEKNQGARPELESHVESMSDYDIVFLGFPNWWYDMPMPLYSFLEEYDFSGKTVIPFVTSASSGFSGTIGTLQEMLPDAVIVENGLHIPMRSVSEADGEVADWIAGLGLTQ
ncbi:flavodoxin [Enterocloster bolteae]|uniref:flavodoxin n=1 Tax=Enterocloster bolteae TaxID=208479 RepID=UPI002A8321F7|nr:flavodoxin [Enterocloster bolteae]